MKFILLQGYPLAFVAISEFTLPILPSYVVKLLGGLLATNCLSETTKHILLLTECIYACAQLHSCYCAGICTVPALHGSFPVLLCSIGSARVRAHQCNVAVAHHVASHVDAPAAIQARSLEVLWPTPFHSCSKSYFYSAICLLIYYYC